MGVGKVILALTLVTGAILVLTRKAKAFPTPTPAPAPTPEPTPTPQYNFEDWRSILQPYFSDVALSTVNFSLLSVLPAGAVTLDSYVYARDSVWSELSENSKIAIIAHELIHVRQWYRDGLWTWASYLWQMFKPWASRDQEIEAIEGERQICQALGIPSWN